MSKLAKGVFIVGAKRTAFGSYGGALKDTTSIELGEVAARAALQHANVKPEHVDSVTAGNVTSCSSNSGPMIARHVGLLVGVPQAVPALTVNRLCGSGFQAVVTAAQDILLNDANIALAVGSENMSQTPFFIRGARFGVKFSTVPLIECGLWQGLADHHVKMPMGATAEKLAKKYGITREEADQLALRSQQRWADAHKRGVFKEETVPVTIKVKGKDAVFDVDEHPRPQTTIEILAKLPSVFEKNGTVTAGNASGVNDGAGAVVLASEEALKQYNLKPLARVVGYCSVGVDPTIMGIGPAPAIRKLCESTGISLNNVDLVDVNEAFASQFCAVEKDLGLDPAKTNVNGGAVALGHPVGASGARITTNLVYELNRRKAKYGIGSACIGGGQGIAIMIENVQ
ncbi:3-ketoacyl-CoA thiolase, mitochondrial-like [Oppia nitens]|uniref:3-ketoacyl-CoA thiolase, mitochondrial-like n=1 Tax=Oppia nitens TaxID=1686743 RepID=UPI0023DCBE02|nr:3-ketoacyl-CoA thiolase, mitochondrial-like [Oppia nitens]